MKLKNSMLVLAATLGTSALLANPAAAQELENIGNQGQFVIGAERITGLFFDKTIVTPDGADEDQTISSTRIALLGSQGATPSGIPRLGFDYLVTDGLSVGVSLFVLSTSNESDDGEDSRDAGSDTLFYINPRVGYAYAFDDTFAIWPRAGIAFTSFSGDNGDAEGESSGNSLQLTVEGNVVISPFEHFAFLVGPFFDLGLSGSNEDDNGEGATSEEDRKFTSFGITAGIAGYFGD